MKKVILLFILSLSFVFATAQNSHLSFLGVPINGNVNTFRSKLNTKGFKTVSNELRGNYKGYNSTLTLRNKANMLYYVAVNIEAKDENEMEKIYQNIKSLLEDEYPNDFFDDSKYKNGHEEYRICVRRNKSDKNWAWKKCYGMITLYTSKYTDVIADEKGHRDTYYSVRIVYYDQINTDKYDPLKM